jgi:hypothetical protein
MNLTELRAKLPTREQVINFLTPLTIFNLSLLFIIIVSGAILFMVMVGMIQIQDPNEKANWFEINAQILNACFTITAVMTQPIRFKLLTWTVKWYRAEMGEEKVKYANQIGKEMPDIILDRGIKKGSVAVDSTASHDRPDSTVEMTAHREDLESPTATFKSYTPTWKWFMILALLNGQCIFQYPITVVQWMYIGRATERPAVVIAVFLPLSFLCGAIGGIWPSLLGRDRKKKEMNS